MRRKGALLLAVATILWSAPLYVSAQRQGGAAQGGRQGGQAAQGARGGIAPQGRQGAAGGRQGRGGQGRNQPTGTALIRGRVVAADTGTPVRRAQIAAQGLGQRIVTTDVEGRYELRDLPAGRWTLTAAKAGFVSIRFGQTRAFESVPPIELAEGQRIDNADFLLPKGAAITGRVYDEFGDPVANARVQVLRHQMVRGRRQLSQTGVAAVTDDTGAYRLYGLAPGQYYVGARAGTGPLDLGPEGVGTYAPTYFPGTANVAEAQRVSLNLGEEQANVSFGLLLVRTARVSGSVIDSSGAPLAGGIVNLTTAIESAEGAAPIGVTGRVDSTGTFNLTNVIPGSYTLLVTSGPGRFGGTPGEVAYMPLTVNGDLANVVVTTTKGATMNGTVIAASGSGQLTPAGIRVQAQPLQPAPGFGQQAAQVAANGTFTLAGLIGPSILRVEQIPQGWMLDRIEVNGTDVSDIPVEFRGSERGGTIRVVLTNRIPQVSGTVAARKESRTGYNVVVFPDEPAKWSFPSRYVRTVRTGADGMFTLRAVPPHDRYLAVAVDYLEDGEATDPEFLQRMRSSATSFSLQEGQSRTLALELVER